MLANTMPHIACASRGSIVAVALVHGNASNAIST